MSKAASLYLGASAPVDRAGGLNPFTLPAHHLTTHGAILGMTGSGKTGLLTVMVEEALLARVPVLIHLRGSVVAFGLGLRRSLIAQGARGRLQRERTERSTHLRRERGPNLRGARHVWRLNDGLCLRRRLDLLVRQRQSDRCGGRQCQAGGEPEPLATARTLVDRTVIEDRQHLLVIVVSHDSPGSALAELWKFAGTSNQNVSASSPLACTHTKPWLNAA